MAEGEVASLRKTLCNQSLTMKKLYTELEEERKASATATEEALAMILRLQEKKAAEKLEACQYKRLAEEKLHHAEETLAILEEAMFQKEIEMASLRYQIQAYKQKLLINNVSNRDVGGMKTFDRSISKSTSILDKRGFYGFVRRNTSLPAGHLDQLCSEMDIIDEEDYLLPRGQSFRRRIDECIMQHNEGYEESQKQNFPEEQVIEECNCHHEQPEKVDINMKDLLQTENIKEKFRFESISENNELQKTVTKQPVILEEECGSCSWYSDDALYDSTVGVGINLNDDGVSYMYSQTEDPENMPECNALGLGSSCLKSKLDANTTNSICLKEIEVLETHSSCTLGESYKQVLQEPTLDAKGMVRIPHSISQEATNKALMYAHGGNKSSTSREEASVNYLSTAVDPETASAPSQTEVAQLKKWMKQLENDMRIMRQEYSNGGKVQLKLLTEIRDQLCTMQPNIKCSKSKKCPPQDDSSLVLLREAMLSFWL